jgi:hypothetical protein
MPVWLSEIVQKLHAKDRADRFQTAADVADLLGRWLSHIEQPTTIPAPARLVHPKANRVQARSVARLWPVAAVTMIVAGALLLAVAISKNLSREPSSSAAHTGVVESAAVAVTEPTDEPLVDDQTMYEDYQELDRRVSRFQRDWSTSPPAVDTWESEIPEIHRQLEDLSKRVDHGGP